MSTAELARARGVARLAAVQALYQMEQSGATPAAMVDDFDSGKLPVDESDPSTAEGDGDLFRVLVEGAVAQQAVIDAAISRRLSEAWRLERIDAVARAILRAGVTELYARKDIPTPVVIDEYVEIAKAFFGDGAETGFVNAALDACAKDVRSG